VNINPNSPSYLLGIDLGGTKIETAVFDQHMHKIGSQRVPTPQGYARVLEEICQQIDHAITTYNLPSQQPVGIGIPGSPNPSSGLIRNANSTCLNGKNLAKDLQNKSSHPIRLANDANCFALAEARDGAGQDANSVFGVILGTGCGGGLVFNQTLWHGASTNAGEWGHNSLPWPTKDETLGPLCWCGQHGCIETWLSGPGMLQRYQDQGGTAQSVEQLAARASKNAAPEVQAIQLYANRLARALASVINLIDVQNVVLGGGLSNLPGLADKTQTRIGRWLFTDQPQVRIVRNKLGDSSGVRGAALLWATP